MARSVRDAALLLDVLAGSDAKDAATAGADSHRSGFADALQSASLKGQRIGIVRSIGGTDNRGQAILDAAVATLRAQGAVVIDPVTLPPDSSYGKEELNVLTFEFKHDLNAYLQARQHPQLPSLAALIDWNKAHAAQELQWFGQELLVSSEAVSDADRSAYEKARARSKQLAGAEGIDATLKRHQLAALVSLTQSPAWTIDLLNGDGGSSSFSSATPAAVAGYPHATVPAGFVQGLPVGVSFFAGAWQDAQVLALAHAFEQAHQARKAPALQPTLQMQ
jgi:amidase